MESHYCDLIEGLSFTGRGAQAPGWRGLPDGKHMRFKREASDTPAEPRRSSQASRTGEISRQLGRRIARRRDHIIQERGRNSSGANHRVSHLYVTKSHAAALALGGDVARLGSNLVAAGGGNRLKASHVSALPYILDPCGCPQEQFPPAR